MKRFYLLVLGLSFLIPAIQAQTTGFKWLRTVNHQSESPYSEGKAAFSDNDKWGYLDKEGNLLIPATFDEALMFSNGLANVRVGDKWGVIKEDGSFLFEPEFIELSHFDSGIALGKTEQSSYYLYADGKKTSLSPQYEYFPYSNGLARVKEKDRWGYVDKEGFFVIKPKYTSAKDFTGEYAFVERKDEPLYINKKGSRKPLPISYALDSVIVFKEGMGRVHNRHFSTFISESDFTPMTARFWRVCDFSEGLAYVTFSDETNGFINSSGNKVISLPADMDASHFSNGMARVKFHKKYGFINKEGELVIDTIFERATDFHDGLAHVVHNGRTGVIKLMEATDKVTVAQIAGMQLEDANLNGVIEAEESFHIAVRVKNAGTDILKDANISLFDYEGGLKGLNMEQMSANLPIMEANTDTVIRFSGKADLDIDSKNIKIDLALKADNLFHPDNRNRQFEVLGIRNCNPVFTKYWVYKDNHSPVKEGDTANMEISVSNDGHDIAKDVKVKVFWPEGTKGESDFFHIPAISPGENLTIKTTFQLDSVLVAEDFTVVATLSEYTNTKSDIKYLPFSSGKLNMETALSTPHLPTQGMPGAQQGNLPNYAQAVQPAFVSELLDGLEEVNPTDANKYALIIGNEKYDDFKRTVSSEQNVEYAQQDADVFAAYARNILGVPSSNIILLKDATYAQMNFNINKLCMISKTKPGELDLVVYYAGHGQHDVDTKETYLIPVDVSISTPTQGIKLEEVYAQLNSCEAHKAMVFLDACYSGVGRGIVIKPKETPVKGNMVVMTASSSTQRSMPYKEKRHGMFTYFLLQKLKETKGNVSMSELYEAVKQEVQKNSIWINNVEQTPELIQGQGIQEDWNTWTVY